MKRGKSGNEEGEISTDTKITRLEVKSHIASPSSGTFQIVSPLDESDQCKNVLSRDCRILSQNKLNHSFYDVPCETLAKSLIGKVLVRSLANGLTLKGRIVETECYLGGEDKASHSYNGKVTPRNKPMYMLPGTTYVYFTYGMYFCFNISSRGDGAAVLLRAVDPLEGVEFMNSERIKRKRSQTKKTDLNDCPVIKNTQPLKVHELCNGPGKLCISYNIQDKTCNMKDLSNWEGMWIETDRESENVKFDDLVISTRIGLNSVDKEWALKPLRFYLYGNRSVSKRDRKKEQERTS